MFEAIIGLGLLAVSTISYIIVKVCENNVYL